MTFFSVTYVIIYIKLIEFNGKIIYFFTYKAVGV